MVELVTKNYTDVIFDLAVEEGKVEEISAELSEIARVMQENPELMAMLASPQIPKAEKLQTADAVFSGWISKTALNFVKVLIENRRAAYLLEIAERFVERKRAHLGIEYVEAITAIPMTQEQKERLIATLAHKRGKQIELNNVIDANIIGGMKIKIGEKALDGTLSNRLKELQSEMSK